jgi:hypothetical protein
VRSIDSVQVGLVSARRHADGPSIAAPAPHCKRITRLVIVIAVLAVFGISGPISQASAAARDDTASLQARLDAGGKITLNKLPGGACYETYGLWVSKNKTTVSSNGACITYLGPGPVRLTSTDGDPIAANAVFFVNRSSSADKLPQRIAISNLVLHVPAGTDGYGVLAAGSDVTLNKLTIDGAPLDAITVTGRANGRGYAGPVNISRGTFLGARRNVLSVIGGVDVTIESNVIKGAGNPAYLGGASPDGVGPWAGIDVEPDLVDYPLKSIQIGNNTIADNYGAGVLLELSTNLGLPKTADDFAISRNAIIGNGLGSGPALRGGICLHGGQANGKGRLVVTRNEIAFNGGYGLCEHPEGSNLKTSLSKNSIHDNSDGDSNWRLLAE